MNYLAGKGLFNNSFRCFGNPVNHCIDLVMRFPEVRDEESERSIAIVGLLLRFMRGKFVRGFEVEGMSWFHKFELNVNAAWSQQCSM